MPPSTTAELVSEKLVVGVGVTGGVTGIVVVGIVAVVDELLPHPPSSKIPNNIVTERVIPFINPGPRIRPSPIKR